MNWFQLGGSLVAILLLAGIAGALRLGRGDPMDEQSAADAAEAALSGFRAVHVQLGRDHRAAMVVGADGSVAAVKQHGAQLAVRKIQAHAVRETEDGWFLDSGERLFGTIFVRR